MQSFILEQHLNNFRIKYIGGKKSKLLLEDIIIGVFGVITGGDELKILWCHMTAY